MPIAVYRRNDVQNVEWKVLEARSYLSEFAMEPIFFWRCVGRHSCVSAAQVLADALRVMAQDGPGTLFTRDQVAKLPPLPKPHFKEIVVLELGSGVGFPSTVAAYLGAKTVVMTEQPPLDELLKKNAATNLSSKLEAGILQVHCLDWNTSREDMHESLQSLEPDIILISDCVYEPLYGTSYIALAETINRFASSTTVVLNSLERRNADGVDEFFEYAKSLGISNELVRKAYDEEEDAELELYVMKRISN